MLEREAKVAVKFCGLFKRILYFAISNLYIGTSLPHQMNACNRELLYYNYIKVAVNKYFEIMSIIADEIAGLMSNYNIPLFR